jgi:hypothetical protein
MAHGDRMTTFEESERESEYGYVRKVCILITPPPPYLSPLQAGSRGRVSRLAWISDA